MKSTGIVRRIDELGRVVLPKELRKTYNLGLKDSVEIFTEGNNIILKKYEPCCVFCGESKDIFTYKGKNVCEDCKKNLTK